MKRNAKIVLSRVAKRKRKQKMIPAWSGANQSNEMNIMPSTLEGFHWVMKPCEISGNGWAWHEERISESACRVSLQPN